MTGARSLIGKAAALIAAAGVFIVPVAIGSSEPVWEHLAAAPAPRQEVSYVALDGKLYLAAGNDRSQVRYDPATDLWQSVAELPASFEGIDHVHGVAVGGRIAYIGGLSAWELPFPVIATVSLYDPGAETFTPGTEMPSPRAAGGVATWNGKVIYAGGLGPDGSVARVDAYDPASGDWTRMADMPRPRDHFQAVVADGKLYAIGGRNTFETGSGNIGVEEIAAVDVLDLPAQVADLPTATWHTEASPLPTLRGGHGVAAVGDCIYVIGGESTSAPDGVTGSTESFNTVTGTWHELSPLWVPRHGIEAATIGGTIYVAAGGADAFGSNPTSAHEALDVSEHEPCVATGPGEPPDPDPEQPQPDGAGAPAAAKPPASDSADPVSQLQVTRLAVQPQRISPGRKAVIVIVLSRSGQATVRLPGHFRLRRHLHAGRNTLPLPRHAADGEPLKPGRYELVARAQGPDAHGRTISARFVVVD